MKSDLPFGSEFSPSQIDLGGVLEIVRNNSGDIPAIEDTIKTRYFVTHGGGSDSNRRKLAMNTRLGLQSYEILGRDGRLTELGEELYSLRSNEKALYGRLAKHILVNLQGTTLIQCLQDMEAAGERIDLVKLRKWLAERGVHFPRGGKHPSMMRLWLAKGGVFVGTWRVDEHRVKELLGMTAEDIDILSGFTVEQTAYLKALANIGTAGPHKSNDVEKLAIATYGISSQEKGLPGRVLNALRDAGYITYTRGTGGRGSKHSMVTATAKLQADLVEPLIRQLEKQTDAKLRPLLRKPLDQILIELDSTNKHVRGLALEALAFKLMRLIDLDYVATRLRGTATGGAEVDVIFESSRLVYSRWQVQCKNTTRVSLDDVAKEVGLTHLLKSNVIVMVSTGKIGEEARRYANKIMNDSNLCIVMIDRKDIASIAKNPASIVNVFQREAVHAMKTKRIEI
ncbi:MAG: restriction endonuclease [Chloracidobacterium sp.]|nr:restriction endonuclease [Chloracidobacterium sp.]